MGYASPTSLYPVRPEIHSREDPDRTHLEASKQMSDARLASSETVTGWNRDPRRNEKKK